MFCSYSYGIKRTSKTCTKWRCTMRNKTIQCQALVTQTGDAVTRGTTEHCHEAESAKATKVKIRRVVKDQAEANLYKSAFTIAESVLLGT